MAVKFGISLSFQIHPGLGEAWDASYRESLELASEANRLGFNSIWASEHHGEADGYCPSPGLIGGAVGYIGGSAISK